MRCIVGALLLSVAVGCGDNPPAETKSLQDSSPATDSVEQKGIAGCWESEWGPISLEHGAIQGSGPVIVTGFWIQGPGKLGEITGATFDPSTGKLEMQTAEPWINQTGTVQLTLSADGKSLEGRGQNVPSGETYLWRLTRMNPGPQSIVGEWVTNWGPVTFEHNPAKGNEPAAVGGFWIQGPGMRGVINEGAFDPRTSQVELQTSEPWINQKSSVQLTLSKDGNALVGSGKNVPSGEAYIWKMIRHAGK